MKRKMLVMLLLILFINANLSILSKGDNTIVMNSNSMSHGESPQKGIIDKGDLLYYIKVGNKDEIITYMEGKNMDYQKFGDYGDVIIYYPMGDKSRTPIIHRAICWVQKNSDGTYDVPEYGIHGATSINIPDLHLSNYKPKNSGFITKGDNNEYPDQMSNGGICEEPVKVEWIVGKIIGLEDKNEETHKNENNGIPGFELIAFIAAAMAVALARKKIRK